MHASANAPSSGSASSLPGAGPSTAPALPAWMQLWTRLHQHIQARAAELNAEVRHYPGPIARCDDQLPKLLDQRAHAMALLQRLNEAAPGGMPDATATRQVLAQCAVGDDDTERTLRLQLHEALDAVRRSEYGYGSGSGRRA